MFYCDSPNFCDWLRPLLARVSTFALQTMTAACAVNSVCLVIPKDTLRCGVKEAGTHRNLPKSLMKTQREKAHLQRSWLPSKRAHTWMWSFVWTHFTKFPFYTVNTKLHLLRDVKLKALCRLNREKPFISRISTWWEGVVRKLLTWNVSVDTWHNCQVFIFSLFISDSALADVFICSFI